MQKNVHLFLSFSFLTVDVMKEDIIYLPPVIYKSDINLLWLQGALCSRTLVPRAPSLGLRTILKSKAKAQQDLL